MHRRTTDAENDSTTPATLIEIEAVQRELARLIEFLAVGEPELARTARMAFYIAGRIRGDRMALG